MTLEKQIQLGKNLVLVGLDFSFGYIKLLPEFGYELSDIDRFFGADKTDEDSKLDAFGFLCAVLKATNKNFHELNDEGEPIITNDSKAAVALLEFDAEVIGQYMVKSMESFAGKLNKDKPTDDVKKKSKIKPSLT